MSIIRTAKRPSTYTQIDNTILYDKHLSWEAKGLAVYLLSKPNDWVIQVAALRKESTNGLGTIRRILRELEEFGYLTRRRLRTEQGTFEWERTLHELPEPPEKRTTVRKSANGDHAPKTSSRKPATGNQQLETSNRFSADIPITENQSLKPKPESKTTNSSSSSILRDGQQAVEEEEEDVVVSLYLEDYPEYKEKYGRLLKGMTVEQVHAFFMLVIGCNVYPKQAKDCAKQYPFRHLLEWGTRHENDLQDGQRKHAGFLLANIKSGPPPEVPEYDKLGGFWLRWARQEDRIDTPHSEYDDIILR